VNDLKLSLRLDSPLVMGGADNRLDRVARIRGGSIRGLLHTWARALFGPLLGGDPGETARAERYLLGAAAGDKEAHPTFLVDVVSTNLKEDYFHPLPHWREKRKAFRPFRSWAPTGIEVDGSTDHGIAMIRLSPRPFAVKNDDNLTDALWAVAWTAFAFGSLGRRARRGLGSLTMTGIERAPFAGLPVWPIPPQVSRLAADLANGLELARDRLRRWLTGRDLNLAAASQHPHAFFQIDGPGCVYLQQKGMASGDELLGRLMQTCSKALDESTEEFRTGIGSYPNNDEGTTRFASPLWFRFYTTSQGRVLLATDSPRITSDLPRSICRDQLQMRTLTELTAGENR
jgi:hypothetical protein